MQECSKLWNKNKASALSLGLESDPEPLKINYMRKLLMTTKRLKYVITKTTCSLMQERKLKILCHAKRKTQMEFFL